MLLVSSMEVIACTNIVDPVLEDVRAFSGESVPLATALGRHADVCGALRALDTSAQTETDPSTVETGSVIRGTWRGAVQGYAFPSGSSALTLTLTEWTNSVVTGTVYLGERPAVSPTNLDLGYPENIRFAESSASPQAPSPPYDQFEYTLLSGQFDGTTLDFAIDPREFWQAWCEAQAVLYPLGANVVKDGAAGRAAFSSEGQGRYSCAPAPRTLSLKPDNGIEGGVARCNYLVAGNDNVYGLIDCDKVALCSFHFDEPPVVSAVCDCTELGCSVCGRLKGIGLKFQLTLQTDGSLTGLIGATSTVSMPWLGVGFKGTGQPPQPTIGGRTLTLQKSTN